MFKSIGELDNRKSFGSKRYIGLPSPITKVVNDSCEITDIDDVIINKLPAKEAKIYNKNNLKASGSEQIVPFIILKTAHKELFSFQQQIFEENYFTFQSIPQEDRQYSINTPKSSEQKQPDSSSQQKSNDNSQIVCSFVINQRICFQNQTKFLMGQGKYDHFFKYSTEQFLQNTCLETDSINDFGVLLILRECLAKQNIKLCLLPEKYQNKLSSYFFKLRDLKFLGSSVNRCSFYLTVKNSEILNFHSLNVNEELRENFFNNLKDRLQDFINFLILSKEENQYDKFCEIEVLFLNLKNKAKENQFRIQIGLPNMSIRFNEDIKQDFVDYLNSTNVIGEHNDFSSLKIKPFLNIICAQVQQLDAWENHQYKRSELILTIPKRGGWDYYQPVGWYLYGLQEKFQNNLNDNDDREQAIAYMPLQFCLSPDYLSKQDLEAYESIFSYQDVRPSQQRQTIPEKVGRGTILFRQADCYEPSVSKNLGFLLPQPVSVRIQNQIQFFLIQLQVLVDSESIRVPDNFNQEIYVVNSSYDIEIRGFIIKPYENNESL